MSSVISKKFDRFLKDAVEHNTRKYITLEVELTQRLLDEDRFHHLDVFADRVILKEDLQFTGKHLRIQAREIELRKNITISTSVTEAALRQPDWGSPLAPTSAEYAEAVFTSQNKDAAKLVKEIKTAFSIGTKNSEVGAFAKSIATNAKEVDWLNALLTYEALLSHAASTERYKDIIENSIELQQYMGRLDAKKNYHDQGEEQQRMIRKANRLLFNLAHLESPECIFIWKDYTPDDTAPMGAHADVKNIHFASPDFTEQLLKDSGKKAENLVNELKKKCGHLRSFKPYTDGPVNNDWPSVATWLNKILTCSRLADELLNGQVPEGSDEASRNIKLLMQQTNRVALYESLTGEQQLQIRRLNRCLLQQASDCIPVTVVPGEQKEQGMKGGQGARGAAGSDGVDAGHVFIAAENIRFNNYQLNIKAEGGRGGRGQSGGTGGNGSDGNIMRSHDIHKFPHNCWYKDFAQRGEIMNHDKVYEYLRTVLHAGGHGGDGGDGGNGGRPGHGGDVMISVVNEVEQVKTNIRITNNGANKAPKGLAGTGGGGGKKGDIDIVVPKMLLTEKGFLGFPFTGSERFVIDAQHRAELKDASPKGGAGKEGVDGAEGIQGALNIAKIGHDAFKYDAVLPRFELIEMNEADSDRLRSNEDAPQKILSALVYQRHNGIIANYNNEKKKLIDLRDRHSNIVERCNGKIRSLQSGSRGQNVQELVANEERSRNESLNQIRECTARLSALRLYAYRHPELRFVYETDADAVKKDARLLVATDAGATTLLKALPDLYFSSETMQQTSMPAELTLMTWHYLKRCYLNGQTEKVKALTAWLLNITPTPDEVEAMSENRAELEILAQYIQTFGNPDKQLWLADKNGQAICRLPAAAQDPLNNLARQLLQYTDGLSAKGWALKLSVNALAQVAQYNLDAGLDFYGHLRNYVPLQGIDAWEKRVGKIMNVAKAIEKEYLGWKKITAQEGAKLESTLKSMKENNNQLDSLRDETQELKNRKKGMEMALDQVQQELQQQIVSIQNVTFDFKDTVQRNATIAGMVTFMNMCLQTVLIASGNTSAASAMKHVVKGIKWAQSNLPVKDGSSIAALLKAAGKSAERNEKYLGDLNTYIKKQKEAASKKEEEKKKKEKEDKEKAEKENSKPTPVSKTITREVAFFYEAKQANLGDEMQVNQKRMAFVMKETQSVSGPVKEKPFANMELKAITDGKAQPKPQDKDDKQPSTWDKVKTKGECMISYAMPLVMEAVALYNIYKDYQAAGATFTYDNVKFALDEASFPALIDHFAEYVSEEDRAYFKNTIKKFQQTAEKRTLLQMEYTALHNKGRELAARNSLLHTEMAYSLEQLAQSQDPMVAAMSRFWELSYDQLRDKLLDGIYEEFQAYRYYALSTETFADMSLARFLNDNKAISDGEADEMARKLDTFYSSQNVALLQLLNETIDAEFFKARGHQFPAITKLSGEACRIRFKRSGAESLFTKKTGYFTISPNDPVFKEQAFLYLSDVKVFLGGLPAGSQVTLKIQHGGTVQVRDHAGLLHEFTHEKPNTVEYGYQVFRKEDKSELTASQKKNLVFNGGNLLYVEKVCNEFVADKEYIRLNPCCTWKVTIVGDVDETLIDSVTFEFNATGTLVQDVEEEVQVSARALATV